MSGTSRISPFSPNEAHIQEPTAAEPRPNPRAEPTTEGAGAKQVRRADIQGLRALAVVLVLAYHAGLPVSGGFIGVDVFFVISGFVIAGMLLPELQATSRLPFALFYARRIRRLFPALAVLIVVVAAGSVFLLSPLGPQQSTAKTGAAAALFNANVELSMSSRTGYFALPAETNAFLHTWSLSVEEQFYLMFPALFLLAWRASAKFSKRGSRRKTTAVIVLIASAASFALSCTLTYRSRTSTGIAFYSPVTRAWEFGAGLLLALALPSLTRLGRSTAAGLGVVGIALIGLGAIAIDRSTAFPGFAAVIPVVGAALILVAGSATTGGVTALLGVRPATWVGDRSYGWYLWHWPLIVFAHALWPGNAAIVVAVAIGSLGPAWLSYRFVEQPIRSNDRLIGRRVAPLALACVALPVAMCLALWFLSGLERNTAVVRNYKSATRLHGEARPACEDAEPVGPQANPRCTWPATNARGTVYLVGDSNAEQFVEPAAKAANQLGFNLSTAIGNGCPFVDLIRESRTRNVDGPACHRFVMRSIASLRQQQPALVIMASSSTQNVNNTEVALLDPHTMKTARSSVAKAKLWRHGLAPVLTELKQAGIPTLLIHTVPHFGPWPEDWLAQGCPAIRMFTHSCGRGLDRVTVEAQQQPARVAEQQALRDAGTPAAVDFTNELCSSQSCVTDRGGRWLYRDATHLSVDGALSLTTHLRDLISRLVRTTTPVHVPRAGGG